MPRSGERWYGDGASMGLVSLVDGLSGLVDGLF
jgi:hypothetical protein